MSLTYRSTKTYTHAVGLTCAFRQHRAESHCRFVHGYALAIRLEFEAADLDVRNWVVDFGSLKSFKGMLETTFDHKLLVAKDDPEIEWFREAARRGVADVIFVPATGCERFAEYIFAAAEIWLTDNGYAPRVRVALVEVREHDGNSAIVRRS